MAQACSHCGSSDTCNCAVIAGRGINVGGNGSVGSPYAIELSSTIIDQTIWCDFLGTPIGYSTTDYEGQQTFFDQNGNALGNVKPETYYECKCDCAQGGGGGDGSVLLNPSYLQYDAYDRVRFVDDGTTSITGGVNGPDVQLLHDQRAAAPLSMSGAFTGAATESQLRRNAQGDLYTLPAFTRSGIKESYVVVNPMSNYAAGTRNFAETALLSITNPSSTVNMLVRIDIWSFSDWQHQTAQGSWNGCDIRPQISFNGGVYNTIFEARSNFWTYPAGGDFKFHTTQTANYFYNLELAPSATLTVRARTQINNPTGVITYNTAITKLSMFGITGQVAG